MTPKSYRIENRGRSDEGRPLDPKANEEAMNPTQEDLERFTDALHELNERWGVVVQKYSVNDLDQMDVENTIEEIFAAWARIKTVAAAVIQMLEGNVVDVFPDD